MAERGYRIILGVRDPRDQLACHYYFYRDRHKEGLSADATEVIQRFSTDEVVTMLFTGYKLPRIARRSLVARYREFVYRWMVGARRHDIPLMLCRYEALMQSKTETAASLADFLGVEVDEPRLIEIADATVPGVCPNIPVEPADIGAWRQLFGPTQIASYKALWGRFLMELGYEADLGW